MSHVWFPPCCRPLVSMVLLVLHCRGGAANATPHCLHTPSGDEASLAGSDIQLSLSAVASRSSVGRPPLIAWPLCPAGGPLVGWL